MLTTHRHRVALALTLALTSCTPAPAPAPALKRADEPPAVHARTEEESVRRLLAVTGAERLGQQIMDATANQLRATPNLPPGFIDAFLKTARTDELVELLVPLYVKHLDQDTVEAAIAFYESPHGRALQGAQPLLLQESMQLGERWGREQAARALQELERR
ncbi:MAG: DUF2059 domain-containing protein [Myxococcales bacterium]|nr:DUF2059 domain-containing protein [Myxococcales bacterium]MCB9755889.1 DUF2059 domain-containing protein [Myxococcales bacterium]